MARVITDDKFPKRIADYVLYKLDNQVVIRANSGFTTEALKTSPKYELSRQNASEFGRVSAICKHIRVGLKDVLPKKNNLLVVNSLTKKMRQVLAFDTISVRGERTLYTAIATENGRQQLNGYHFNPEVNALLVCEFADDVLRVASSGIVFPDGANSVGLACLVFEFDFETATSQLVEGARQFYSKDSLPASVDLVVPILERSGGVLFTLLTIQFYTQNQGSYVPVEDDRSKVVLIVSCEL